jgi:hypothetical protein
MRPVKAVSCAFNLNFGARLLAATLHRKEWQGYGACEVSNLLDQGTNGHRFGPTSASEDAKMILACSSSPTH